MNAAATALNQAAGLPDGAEQLERLARLKQACADVESLFVSTLLKAMRDTIPDSGLMPEAAGSDIYESIADQQFSVHLSNNGGLGLGRTVYDQMVRREDLADLEEKYPVLRDLHYTVTATPALLSRMGSPIVPVPADPSVK